MGITSKEELLKASTAKYVAKENAQAEIEKAEGEKQAKILRAQGDKVAGELGIDVEKTEDAKNDFSLPHLLQSPFTG